MFRWTYFIWAQSFYRLRILIFFYFLFFLLTYRFGLPWSLFSEVSYTTLKLLLLWLFLRIILKSESIWIDKMFRIFKFSDWNLIAEIAIVMVITKKKIYRQLHMISFRHTFRSSEIHHFIICCLKFIFIGKIAETRIIALVEKLFISLEGFVWFF